MSFIKNPANGSSAEHAGRAGKERSVTKKVHAEAAPTADRSGRHRRRPIQAARRSRSRQSAPRFRARRAAERSSSGRGCARRGANPFRLDAANSSCPEQQQRHQPVAQDPRPATASRVVRFVSKRRSTPPRESMPSSLVMAMSRGALRMLQRYGSRLPCQRRKTSPSRRRRLRQPARPPIEAPPRGPGSSAPGQVRGAWPARLQVLVEASPDRQRQPAPTRRSPAQRLPCIRTRWIPTSSGWSCFRRCRSSLRAP